MSNDNLRLVEAESGEILEEFGDLLSADIDLSRVDLGMPELFEIRMVANQRIGLVRDASILRLNLAANKATANSATIENLQRELNWRLWEIALIDKRYPRAAKLSKEQMADIAAQEHEAEQARRKAR